MNENLDLTKILKDAPKDTKLYSPVYGECILKSLGAGCDKPVLVWTEKGYWVSFGADGKWYEGGECLLFPSREQRDWSKFRLPRPVHRFEPFERILVRDEDTEYWKATLFSHYTGRGEVVASCLSWKQCIPYKGNEHLIGTCDSPEEGGQR